MTLQRHYDDEQLIAMLESERDAARDGHLSQCRTCAEALEAYRGVVDVLRDETTWKDEPDAAPPAAALSNLRQFASRMAYDERSAAALIDEIMQLPRQWWAMKVAAEARFQTAAMARGLVERSEAAIDAMPPDAVELARAATVIAEEVGDKQTIGGAYRQYAYALFYCGEIARALQAIDKSAAALAACASSEYELGRLDIVKAVVFTAQELYDAAINASRSAQRRFNAFSDRRRVASAFLSEAYALLAQLRYRAALPILLSIERDYRYDIDCDTRARVIANIALCEWQTGNVINALQSYELAAALHESAGTKTEAARIRLNIAGVLAANGRTSEAKSRLRALREEFITLGMHYEVVFAGLVLAEILLAEGSYEDVEALCKAAIEQFGASGAAHRSEVLTALGYLREASGQKRVTPEAVREVKKYIERLPNEPNLLFAPPPLRLA